MGRVGFVGASYASLSSNADAQVCRNWVPESIESQQGKGPIALYDREGLVPFATLPAGAVRGQYTINGRTFAVGGAELYEVVSNGTANPLAAVVNDGLPAYFAANSTGTQLAFSSGGTLYVIALPAATVSAISGATFSQGPVSKIDIIDDIFVALIGGTNIFYNSAPDDATTWTGPGNGANQVSIFPGNLVAMVVDQRQLFLGGLANGAAYYNSGASSTPIIPIPGGTIANGVGAAASVIRQDNTVFWLDGDTDKGNGIFRRYQSGGPVRVSNHAVETTWQTYSTISDCIGFPYQNRGHAFCVLYFPSANSGRGATWVYDVATGLWHERDFWNPATGLSSAYLGQNHTFNFGKHLVGDWNSGNIYSLSNTVMSDNGGPIRRVRRAPHISAEQKRIYHSELQVDVEVGLGPIPPLLDGAGNPRGPQLMLRWSDNSAKTWSNEYVRDCGQAGQYNTRVRWLRLGQSRDRIYELSATDPVPMRIIDAYLQASGAAKYEPAERLSKELSHRA